MFGDDYYEWGRYKVSGFFFLAWESGLGRFEWSSWRGDFGGFTGLRFFAEYGDICGRVCVLVGIFFFLFFGGWYLKRLVFSFV